jgi:hypothetical protein
MPVPSHVRILQAAYAKDSYPILSCVKESYAESFVKALQDQWLHELTIQAGN